MASFERLKPTVNDLKVGHGPFNFWCLATFGECFWTNLPIQLWPCREELPSGYYMLISSSTQMYWKCFIIEGGFSLRPLKISHQ